MKPVIACVNRSNKANTPVMKQLRAWFGTGYDVLSATSGKDFSELMADLDSSAIPLALCISGEKFPDTTGIDLLATLLRSHPCTVRVLFSHCSNVEMAIEAVNRAHVDHIVPIPWPGEALYPIVRGLLAAHDRRLRDAASSAPRGIHLIYRKPKSFLGLYVCSSRMGIP